MKHCQQEMTVIQNAWPVVCNFGWLIEADRNARKGKRYRAEVLNFTARLEDNLFTIQQGMMNGSYVLGPYRKLWVYVPKKRLVMALDYPDRIVQWSLYLYLNPIYDKLFIEDSYACRKDKGSHKAAKRLQYWMCQVQRKLGARRFRAIFKSITFDNGTEFAAAEGLERSCVNKRLPRTKVYFCHPYSSWERGTNENTNGMIRRRFPKGTNFAAVTNAQIAQAENWINNYPRKILGYRSSEIVFRECLRELGIAA